MMEDGPDDVAVPTFLPRMACTGRGIVGADARPNWNKRPPPETAAGVQSRSLRGEQCRTFSERQQSVRKALPSIGFKL
jgi:hypothetical protein